MARFLVPSLHYLEIANVLRTYVLRGELPRPLAQEIFDTHLEAGLKTVNPKTERTLEIALDYQATAYDAVCIGLSLEYQTPLLTAERKTVPWVVNLGDLTETLWVAR